MTREEAIQRANELGGAAIARPYSIEKDGSEVWGVTDTRNLLVPPRGGVAEKAYQKRFIEV
jgi:hypothetical protein